MGKELFLIRGRSLSCVVVRWFPVALGQVQDGEPSYLISNCLTIQQEVGTRDI